MGEKRDIHHIKGRMQGREFRKFSAFALWLLIQAERPKADEPVA